MIATVVLVSPSSKVRGFLGNSFLEPHPNVFVGNLTSTQMCEVVEVLKQQDCTGIVIAATPKSPIPRMLQLGCPQRRIVEIDGLQFLKIR